MKFKFTGQKEKEELEPIATLCFENDGNDGVDIIATMPDGIEWQLLKLNHKGTFSKYGSIENDVGFKVSKAGYLKEQK